MRATNPDKFIQPPFGNSRHACAFFDGKEEAYRSLLPFIAEGFSCGESAIHIIPPDDEQDHLDRLAELGIDHAAARCGGILDVLHDTDLYLADGHFDPDRMLTVFEDMARRYAAVGPPASRIVCNMDWSAGNASLSNDLLEFEARVNDVWSRHEDTVICVYDTKKFGGDFLVDILRTHPLVLVGEGLHENPFFTPPADFLRGERFNRRDLASKP